MKTAALLAVVMAWASPALADDVVRNQRRQIELQEKQLRVDEERLRIERAAAMKPVPIDWRLTPRPAPAVVDLTPGLNGVGDAIVYRQQRERQQRQDALETQRLQESQAAQAASARAAQIARWDVAPPQAAPVGRWQRVTVTEDRREVAVNLDSVRKFGSGRYFESRIQGERPALAAIDCASLEGLDLVTREAFRIEKGTIGYTVALAVCGK